jgi:hypothetical protein
MALQSLHGKYPDHRGDKLPERQLSTAASRSRGLNGFWTLETAPSLVAICKKFGACLEADWAS